MEGQIAVNLCDLTVLVPRGEGFNPVALLLKDFMDEASPRVTPRKDRWDTDSIVLDGPAARDPERLDAVVQVLQTILGPRKMGRRVRCYRQGKRGGWTEIRP